MWTSRLAVLFAFALVACGEDPPIAPRVPAPPPAPAPPPTPAPVAAPEADEACARVIVVAWQGAEHAAPAVTRSEAEARARAESLHARVDASPESFADVARAESDAASSGPRGGLLGTYTRADWPAAHEPIRDAVFALSVGQVSQVVRAPYGWVVLRRCPVEKVHTRHILIRYAGARRAPEDVTRTREQARALAEQTRARATAPGADFAAVAREVSEDGSAENGGDIGVTGRGLLAEAYEGAAYALGPNEISQVVETDFGFHVIQRLPD
ncbi:MAG: peptidylprolyl isomerase [Sandaracinaceae bacterium]|nr:peptidylprolyl isomerase [Sandaracinaceae bacterium]